MKLPTNFCETVITNIIFEKKLRVKRVAGVGISGSDDARAMTQRGFPIESGQRIVTLALKQVLVLVKQAAKKNVLKTSFLYSLEIRRRAQYLNVEVFELVSLSDLPAR